MKFFIISLFFAFSLASCSKDKTDVISTTVATGVTKFSGVFNSTPGVAASGNAKILYDGNRFSLVLDNFQVSSGPDLKVYLSKKDTPFEFINLGALKSNSGNQTYEIPNGVDFAIHRYALIHCQRFNHLFAIAQLKP